MEKNLNQEKYDYEGNGVYRTPEEQRAHESWIKDQQDWKEEQKAKEDKLEKEYFDLSDKMNREGVSDEEFERMEKRQDEILDEVSPDN
ncbi:hypothetical protein [Staphylococcus pettenkoferi]|uniref:hypothetical protein n=1 Tax=Staphylococcus pettenkoferi TaxID=170573 RepID=UPI00119CD907|nr:hypothetical protein [Staphylococcus pettenkoferi]